MTWASLQKPVLTEFDDYDFQARGFSPRRSVILRAGGFALVRRWIQTPSVAKVRSATMRRGRSSSELPLRPAVPTATAVRLECGNDGAETRGYSRWDQRVRADRQEPLSRTSGTRRRL